jgi:hypothetical protein
LKNVQTIKENAFRCTSIMSVYLPDTLTTLETKAFERCGKNTT